MAEANTSTNTRQTPEDRRQHRRRRRRREAPLPDAGGSSSTTTTSSDHQLCYLAPESVVQDRSSPAPGGGEVVRVDSRGGLWVQCADPQHHCYTLWAADADANTELRLDLSSPGPASSTEIKILGSENQEISLDLSVTKAELFPSCVFALFRIINVPHWDSPSIFQIGRGKEVCSPEYAAPA
ncbi:unnamed protein product [Notodromas monacha]|uniref:Uncharacterized protein n=1 Tax=Notodromas monacha TaxID=399045 RepID=A0A7R9GEB3_9CRUS|nr:unnamed protein product [Notodromas monacha]CAG0917693.1 unnamed protein product [Notodromas monacha]